MEGRGDGGINGNMIDGVKGHIAFTGPMNTEL
jgi:hypothetical protein